MKMNWNLIKLRKWRIYNVHRFSYQGYDCPGRSQWWRKGNVQRVSESNLDVSFYWGSRLNSRLSLNSRLRFVIDSILRSSPKRHCQRSLLFAGLDKRKKTWPCYTACNWVEKVEIGFPLPDHKVILIQNTHHLHLVPTLIIKELRF
jgi:hypothetical protein